MIGFVIWSLLGVFIIGLGIKDMFSKNPVGFWANTETIKVKDVKGYNRASGLLFIIYGIIFVILGIPLLDGQNTPYVLLSVIGVMVETIVIMAAYSLVIVKKYEEKSSPNLCVNSSFSYVVLSTLLLSSRDLTEWSLVYHSTLSYQRFYDLHSIHYDHLEGLHQLI